MKYSIVYLLGGEAKKYQENLMKDISERFNVQNLNEKIMPHITFKSPFRTDDISDLEKRLDKFTRKNKSSEISINGFGSFNEEVLYLNVEFSERAKKTFRRLNKKISDLDYIDFNEYDNLEDNFHSTLAITENRNKFNKIKNYLEDNYNPGFDLDFDNIAVIKKHELKREWEIDKIYNLK